MNPVSDRIIDVAEKRLKLIRLNSNSKLLDYSLFYELFPDNGIAFYVGSKLNDFSECFPNDGLISICLEEYDQALTKEIEILTSVL